MVNLIKIKDVEFFMDHAVTWSANDTLLYIAKIEKPMISIGTKGEDDDLKYNETYVQEKGLPVKKFCRTGGVIVHVPGNVCLAMVRENTKENYLFFQKLNDRIALSLGSNLMGND